MSGKRGLIDANSKPSSCIMKKSRQPCPSNNKPQPQSGNGSPEMQLSFESNNSLLLPHAPDSMDTYQTPANGENVEMCTDNRDDDHVGSSHSGPAEILRSIAHEMTIIPLKFQHDEQVTNTHIEMVQPIEGKD
ncbi:hypothetical protein QAD02_018876 [Eretmocerus hayati]|uniref:Uncharacterized protein n=1 Tax=Eretmocerus hayati TaxID=131215 RepID=A0ACC2PIF9_9HYME|nr:hypothetical protein QAD02_018876 [Eretmocerus hayati]